MRRIEESKLRSFKMKLIFLRKKSLNFNHSKKKRKKETPIHNFSRDKRKPQ
jgi:hypothetical protein